MRSAAFFAVFLLVGCTDSTVYLKNPSGQIVTCGNNHFISLPEAAIQAREAQCIEDYKAQGYVRVPTPK